MPRALKVFSTSAGFYEAVVAAPSRKAALAAWGVHDDLFASGAAQEVDDPQRVAAALAAPGEIVRVPIDLGVIPASLPQPRPSGKAVRVRQAPKPKPRPDRSALDAAEAALTEVERRRDDDLAALAQARRELDTREAEVRAAADRELGAARDGLDRARRIFERAGGDPGGGKS